MDQGYDFYSLPETSLVCSAQYYHAFNQEHRYFGCLVYSGLLRGSMQGSHLDQSYAIYPAL